MSADATALPPSSAPQSLPLRSNVRFKHCVMWLVQLLKGLSSTKEYVILLPPFFASQRVWHKPTGSLVRFTLRTIDDWYTMNQVFGLEDYNLRRLRRFNEIMQWYRDILARGRKPLIIDCGANIGLSVLYFAARFPEARIVAVEPELSNSATAKLNASGPNITHVNAAIAAREGAVEIVSPSGENAFRTVVSDHGTVASTTVPRLLEEASRDGVEPFIIKIDIEGFESNLFEENTDWVATFPLLIIELHDWMLCGQASARPFLKVIADHNRDFVHLSENVFSIRN